MTNQSNTQLATQRPKSYVKPHIRVVNFWAECSGIGIGSGDTSPEECDSNISNFEEQTSFNTNSNSVWDE